MLPNFPRGYGFQVGSAAGRVPSATPGQKGIPTPDVDVHIQSIVAGLLGRLAGREGPSACGSVREILASLSPEQTRQLHAQLGQGGLRSLLSLAQESDPQLFYQDLSHLGQQSLDDDKTGAALLIFRLLSQNPSSSDDALNLSAIPEGIRRRAQENLDLLSGNGPIGRQIEFKIQNLLQGAADPAMIGGMAIGSSVFTFSRSLILPRLLAARGAYGWTTGFGVRLTASSLALMPEVGAFWLSSKGMETLLTSEPPNWDFRTNMRELAGLTLTLGLLKSTGFIFNWGQRWATSIPLSGPMVSDLGLWSQAGMFTGIALAHGMEAHWGWRQPQGPANFLADSLMTLIQFNLGARLSQAVFPGLFLLNSRLQENMSVLEAQQVRSWEAFFRKEHDLPKFSEFGIHFSLNPETAIPGPANWTRETLRPGGIFDHIFMSQKLPESPVNGAQATSGGKPLNFGFETPPSVEMNSGIPRRIARPFFEWLRQLEREIQMEDQAFFQESFEVSEIYPRGFQITVTLPESSAVRERLPENPDYENLSISLKALGWGPLLIKNSAGVPRQFRVMIPDPAPRQSDDYFTMAPRYLVDLWGRGPRTPLEESLSEGFYVPASSLGTAISRALEELPGGPKLLYHNMANQVLNPQPSDYPLAYRRMELIHRILLGPRHMEDLTVIENGVGTVIDTTVTLARMGAKVQIKEPDEFSLELHQHILDGYFKELFENRVRYIPTPDRVSADMVYWVNPGPRNIEIFNEMGSGEYLGRDLKGGGFAIVQTDHHLETTNAPYLRVRFDPLRWRKIFEDALPPQAEGVNYAFPTAQTQGLFLQIYQSRLD